MKNKSDTVKWLDKHASKVLAITIVIVFVIAAIVIDQNFKRTCRAKGGHVVIAMGASQVCVDENEKVIKR